MFGRSVNRVQIPVGRLTLATAVQKLGRTPSTKEKLNVEEKRERLQARVDAFHKHASEFWGVDSEDNGLVPPEMFDFQELGASDSEESSTEEDNDYVWPSPWIDDLAAEAQPLPFPSNLGMTVDQEGSHSTFAKQEKTLRIGQANDALQGVRLGLSRKSVIFREDLRKSKTKTRKLRSWDQIIMVDINVRHHARVYGRARAALTRLGATEEELQRYQVLKQEHLNVTTARIDPSLRGQRDSSLAWFWTMDLQNDIDQLDGMAECEVLENCILYSLTNPFSQSIGFIGSKQKPVVTDGPKSKSC
jgi:hypothetical protein